MDSNPRGAPRPPAGSLLLPARPLVSVVVPLHNKAPYVTRALQSVLGQTQGDFELLVVDDGSTDDGASMVAACTDPRLRLLCQPNRGAAAARARGMAEAAGRYVAFLDADDEWLPHFLERAVALLEDHPQAGAGGLAYEVWEADGTRRLTQLTGMPAGEFRGVLPDYFAAALGDSPLSSSTAIIRRETIDRLHPVTTTARLGEDQLLWCQLALHCPIAFDSTIGGRYHQEAADRTSARLYYDGPHPAVELLARALANGGAPGLRRRSIRNYMSKKRLDLVWRAIENADLPLARRLLWRSMPTIGFAGAWLKYVLRCYAPSVKS